MGTLARLKSFRRTRAGKLILGGAAAGVGAAAGTALGADKPDAPQQVALGARDEGRGQQGDEVVLNLEGRKARVKRDTGLRDDLDSRVAAAATTTGTGDAQTPNTVDTAGTNTGTNTAGTSSAGTNTGGTNTNTPDTVATPNTPDTPDSPDTPDTPPSPETATATADSPDNSGPGSNSSGPGSGGDGED